VRQAEADAGERAERLTSGEREELKRQRGEIKELRRANEILKAASVFFDQGARPDPTEVSAFIDERRADFRGRASLSDPGRVGVRPLPASKR
jgi:hypothetical protein